MRFLITGAMILLFISNGFSQKVSLKIFSNYGELHDFDGLRESFTDTNYYNMVLVKKTVPFLRPAVSLEFESKNFIEFSGMVRLQKRTEYLYRTVSQIRIDSSTVFDSTFFTRNSFQGEGNRKYYEFQTDYFWHFPHLEGERLRTYWGIGARAYYQDYTYTPDENSTIYALERRRGGMFFMLNTRLHWEFQNPAWQIQGIFGIQTFDLGFIDSYTATPGFTERQRRNGFYNMDLSLDAYWKIGISYTFNMKNESTEEK